MYYCKPRTDRSGRQDERREWTLTPRADIAEHDDHYRIEIDLPGVAKETIDLQVEEGELRLTASREHLREGESFLHRERRNGTYCRLFRLSDQIDTSRAEASLEEGVLRVRLPKAARTQNRKIEIREVAVA